MAEPPVFISPEQLVERWGGRISASSLSRWRSKGKGPKYIVLGGKVAYRLSDVEEYEREQSRGAGN